MAGPQTPQRIRGTQDMIGEAADRFARVVDTFERVRRLYAFRRVEVPMFEATQVFARSIGEATDIVSKEMYTFPDRGGDLLTLRPEFTAGIARAFLTEGWRQYAPLKLATYGSVFRYERPQKGRFREFHQLDAEVIGVSEPSADVELLVFADHLLRRLGISGVTLQLNTLGDTKTRGAWRSALINYFGAHEGELSDESRDRLRRNPLRILDSKDPRDRQIAEEAPCIDAFMSNEAGEFFDQVQKGLESAGVRSTRNPRLVRGLDYYRHTAFEFVTDRLGSQGTVLAGGRYDGLMESLGGAPTPAVGWAAGIERLAMLIARPNPQQLDFVVVPDTDDLIRDAQRFTDALRYMGRPAEIIARGSPRKRGEKGAALDPKCLVFFSPIQDAEPDLYRIVVKGRTGSPGNQRLWRWARKAIEGLWSIEQPHDPSSIAGEMLWDGVRVIVRRRRAG